MARKAPAPTAVPKASSATRRTAAAADPRKPAAPRRAAGTRTSAAATQSAPAASRLRVRMYRQGLGDCFLVSVLGAGSPFHMLIDCGVILGTRDADEKLKAVVTDIAAETRGAVDILVVTHEHYDHVSGFVLAENLFSRNGVTGGKLSADEVWFAWTEDPSSPLANKLRAGRKAAVDSLAAFAGRVVTGLRAESPPETVDSLRFFGVGPNGSGVGATARAMANAAQFGKAVRYRRPGERIVPDKARDLAIYVLGPPQDEAAIRRTDSTTETYHIALDDQSETVLVTAAQSPDGDGGDPYLPFDRGYMRSLSAIRAGCPAPGMTGSADDPTTAFIRARYFGPDNPSPDQKIDWRQIDQAWMSSAEQLALALDSATNNTSLVLAIEAQASGKVLLFAADAQVGNWLSWDRVTWDAGVTTSAADLLKRTVFYKVGHHGSHNATLKQHGLEEMESLAAAFIPVDQAMAAKKGWGKMPLPSLVDALTERSHGHVVRVDTPPPADMPDVTVGPDGPALPSGPFGPLYYEWTMPL